MKNIVDFYNYVKESHIADDDYWNSIVKIRDYAEDESIKAHADMLLRQRNTAGGRAVIPEMKSFVEEYIDILDKSKHLTTYNNLKDVPDDVLLDVFSIPSEDLVSIKKDRYLIEFKIKQKRFVGDKNKKITHSSNNPSEEVIQKLKEKGYIFKPAINLTR